MIDNTKIVDIYTYMPVLQELLSQGKEVSITITGNSMSPFLVHGRDKIMICLPMVFGKKGTWHFL